MKFLKIMFMVLAVFTAGVGVFSWAINPSGPYMMWFVASALFVFSAAMQAAQAKL